MEHTVEIRRAELSDVKAIAEIEKACFSVPWSENALAESINNPLTELYCAIADNTIAGYIGIYCIADEGNITNVAVLPEFRKKGIASALICTAQERARDKGITKLMLEVRLSNSAAVSLYEKHDFQRAAIRKNYYTHPKEDALLMDKAL